jgi:hypothetical protein
VRRIEESLMTRLSSCRNRTAPRLFARLLGAVALILGLAALAAEPLPATSGVVVNGEALSTDTIAAYAAQYGQAPAPGRYWYDGATGAWGHEGQGTAGFIPPGLALGGPLRSDASNGRTGVWINGRQLADSDVLALAAIGVQAQPGRWWVDALGNAGAEGGPALFNLHALARRAGGEGLWRGSSDGSSLWLGGDGSLSYHGKVGDREFDYHIGD